MNFVCCLGGVDSRHILKLDRFRLHSHSGEIT